MIISTLSFACMNATVKYLTHISAYQIVFFRSIGTLFFTVPLIIRAKIPILGKNKKLLLARAIQLFMPGIPQIWYLDLFAGKNDYEAANRAGSGGHKEINRTTLSLNDIEDGLKEDIVIKQLELIRLRNTSKAFLGDITINDISNDEIDILWKYEEHTAHLKANLQSYDFTLKVKNGYVSKTNFS